MQLGFLASGTHADVLASVEKQVEDQKAKFAKECAEHQVFIGIDKDGKTNLHRPHPIKDSASADLADAALLLFKEQTAHLKPDEECDVSFQITVHRRNPE